MNVTVSNTVELSSALTAAHAGDVIQLKAGIYSYLALTNVKFAGSVTITSADATKPVLIDGIGINNSSGLRFVNVDIDYTEKLNGSVQVMYSTNVSFDNVELVGNTVGRPGNGMIIRGSDNVTVNNADIHDFTAGIGHQDSTHVTISNSKFHDIAMDGVRGGGSSWVTVSGNTFTDFHKIQYSHNDAIQFWTSGTTASVHDLVITNNTITQGSGDAVQGIFMNNEMGYTYQNVTITGNAIIGPGYHGITVEKAENIRIDGNLVEGYKDLGGWIYVKNSNNVSLQHNISTSWINEKNTAITVGDNKTIALGAVGDTSVLNYWLANGHTIPDSWIVTPTSGTAPTSPGTPAVIDAAKSLIGTLGSDLLVGGSGNDTLDGHGGADTLTGGAGNDLYIVNGYSSYVTERADGGTDTVRTGLDTYTLSSYVENLSLTGTAAQRAFGNGSNNLMTGNSVRSTLSGGDGADTLVSNGSGDTLTGGAGKDVFVFGKAPAVVATVTDFTAASGDVLDLRSLLKNYQGLNPVTDGYVRFVIDSTGTTVSVDLDGRLGPGGFAAVAKLTGVGVQLTQAQWLWSHTTTTTNLEGYDADDGGYVLPLDFPEPTATPMTTDSANAGDVQIDYDALLASLHVGWAIA